MSDLEAHLSNDDAKLRVLERLKTPLRSGDVVQLFGQPDSPRLVVLDAPLAQEVHSYRVVRADVAGQPVADAGAMRLERVLLQRLPIEEQVVPPMDYDRDAPYTAVAGLQVSPHALLAPRDAPPDARGNPIVTRPDTSLDELRRTCFHVCRKCYRSLWGKEPSVPAQAICNGEPRRAQLRGGAPDLPLPPQATTSGCTSSRPASWSASASSTFDCARISCCPSSRCSSSCSSAASTRRGTFAAC